MKKLQILQARMLEIVLSNQVYNNNVNYIGL